MEKEGYRADEEREKGIERERERESVCVCVRRRGCGEVEEREGAWGKPKTEKKKTLRWLRVWYLNGCEGERGGVCRGR